MELNLYLVAVFLTLCSQIVVEISCEDTYTQEELNAIEEVRNYRIWTLAFIEIWPVFLNNFCYPVSATNWRWIDARLHVRK